MGTGQGRGGVSSKEKALALLALYRKESFALYLFLLCCVVL